MWSDRPSATRFRRLTEAVRRVAPPPGGSGSARRMRRELGSDLEAAAAAGILGRRPGLCWLDGDERLYVEPVAVLEARDGRARIRGVGGEEELVGGGFDLLEAALEAWKGADGVELVGYLGYELAGELETLPPPPADDTRLPDLRLGLYDTVVRRVPGGWGLEATGGWRDRREIEELIEELVEELVEGRSTGLGTGAPAGSVTGASSLDHPSSSRLRSRPDRRGYVEAVARSVGRIRDGELFQVNLCRRLEVTGLRSDPLDLYMGWRERDPAPRGAFLALKGRRAVLSASPETFLEVRGDRVLTRPIKGTRPRGRTSAEDDARVRELLDSSKDRAELAMIVDLMRNDLGRICRTGTVRVDEHFRPFRLPTVHHTVSTVSGRLQAGVGPAKLLRASFPAGSITGAPKIRAMEIIAEEEPRRRGPAMGAIGRIAPSGDLDLSVAIRTAVAVDDRLVYHAGAGLVADSDPEGEWRETRAKAAGLLGALGLGETDGLGNPGIDAEDAAAGEDVEARKQAGEEAAVG